MSRYRQMNSNPITPNFIYGSNQVPYGSNQVSYGSNQIRAVSGKPKRHVDGFAHICADGHNHASELEVSQCIDAHKVFVCSSNHMHTDHKDSERCDQIKREEELLKDKELQRKHEREMADKQIKMADNLRAMGWNFKQHGMPQLTWKES